MQKIILSMILLVLNFAAFANENCSNASATLTYVETNYMGGPAPRPCQVMKDEKWFYKNTVSESQDLNPGPVCGPAPLPLPAYSFVVLSEQNLPVDPHANPIADNCQHSQSIKVVKVISNIQVANVAPIVTETLICEMKNCFYP